MPNFGSACVHGAGMQACARDAGAVDGDADATGGLLLAGDRKPGGQQQRQVTALQTYVHTAEPWRPSVATAVLPALS